MRASREHGEEAPRAPAKTGVGTARMLRIIKRLDQEVAQLELLCPTALDKAEAVLADKRFEVLVLGEFSRGKSTLINALLGIPLLPKGLRPTTATITRVEAGDSLRIQISGRDEAPTTHEPQSLEEASRLLKGIVTHHGKADAKGLIVDVTVPGAWASQDLVLVDTPGTQDLDSTRDEISYGYLPRADAALFLLDAGKPLVDTERIFLCDRVIPRDLHRILFILNRVDSVKDPADVVRRTRHRIQDMLGIADPIVVGLSAKAALAARRDGDEARFEAAGGRDLRDVLHEYLLSGPGELRAARAIQLLQGALSELDQHVGHVISVLSSGAGEAEEELLREEADLEKQEAQLEAVAQQHLLDREKIRERLAAALTECLDLLRGKMEFAFSLTDLWAIRSAVARLQREFVESVLRVTTAEIRRAYAFIGDQVPEVPRGVLAQIPDQSWETGLGIEGVGGELAERDDQRAMGIGFAGAAAGLILGAATAGLGIGLAAAVLGYMGGASAMGSVQNREDKARLRASAELWIGSTQSRMSSWSESILSEIESTVDEHVTSQLRHSLEQRRAAVASLRERIRRKTRDAVRDVERMQLFREELKAHQLELVDGAGA